MMVSKMYFTKWKANGITVDDLNKLVENLEPGETAILGDTLVTDMSDDENVVKPLVCKILWSGQEFDRTKR